MVAIICDQDAWVPHEWRFAPPTYQCPGNRQKPLGWEAFRASSSASPNGR